MIYSINTTLVEQINSLRQELEYLVIENGGKVTQETIEISKRLDRLPIIYYQKNLI
jgi:hypothetical protein